MDGITTIEEGFTKVSKTVSNINEHIPVLAEYAEKCTSVAELGVKEMTTTWAFMKGLRFNKKKRKHLVCLDIMEKPERFDKMCSLASKNRVNMEFIKGDSKTTKLPKVDLLYIDTTHFYLQLKSELEYHHANVKKYIIMHNTEVDATYGELLRMCYYFDVPKLAKQLNCSVEDLCKGTQPAIEEFLAAHPEWKVEKHLKNNNGLTILSKDAGDEPIEM
jgi:hypothetical protein